MTRDLEVALRITAKDSTQGVLGKTRAGLESISRQLEVARNAFVAFQGALQLRAGIAGLAALADQVQQVNARLRLATSSMQEFAAAQALAYRVAAQTGAGYEAVSTLYARLAQALADGLGLPLGRLRELAEAGLLTGVAPQAGGLAYIEDEAKLSAYAPTGWSACAAV